MALIRTDLTVNMKIRDTQVLHKGPRSMITLLTNRELINREDLGGIRDMGTLKEDILRRIETYHDGEDLMTIFHLIQIWGGSSGRNIYIRGGGFCPERVIPHYTALVQTCLAVEDITEDSMQQLVLAIHQFDQNVNNIGIAFITKHVHFWLRRNLGCDALPIYDSVMAHHIMHQRSVRYQNLIPYWNRMIEEAAHRGVSVCELEEVLFHRFRPYNE